MVYVIIFSITFVSSMHVDPADIQISISPTSATSYVNSSGRKKTRRLIQSYKTNFEKERQDNLLSASAARKLRRSINWLVHTSREKRIFSKELGRQVRFRLSFITLTLPSDQVHSDTLIKRDCLNTFFQWLRDKHNCLKYVWKAEIQKNGNIHFHITTDKFIAYREVQRAWNRCLDKLGYIDRFEEQHGHRNPPSTEIKSVKKAKNLGSYLAAYLADGKDSSSKKAKKEYNSRVIKGRLFGVSRYLSRVQNIRISADVCDFWATLDKLRKGAYRVINGDFSTTYIFDKEWGKSFVYWLHNEGYEDLFKQTNLSGEDLRAWLVDSG